MISTHILDTSKGAPAAGVSVRLLAQENNQWKQIASGISSLDGRITFSLEIQKGVYQLIFDVEEYLKEESSSYFFHSIPVIFKIEDANRKYHIPLLLNPFGYSTYRGS